MTITKIKELNANAGYYFFSENTMQFFNSIVYKYVYSLGHDKYAFITSEQRNENTPRLYTIRIFNYQTCNIITYGNFQAYDTLNDALEVAININL